MQQRRESERVEVETALYILWEAGGEAVGSGKITSLSRDGCFVQTRSGPATGQPIQIRLRLPTERWMTLKGSVVHLLRKVGFGVRFADLTGADGEMLALLIDYYREEPLVLTATVCEPESGAGKQTARSFDKPSSQPHRAPGKAPDRGAESIKDLE